VADVRRPYEDSGEQAVVIISLLLSYAFRSAIAGDLFIDWFWFRAVLNLNKALKLAMKNWAHWLGLCDRAFAVPTESIKKSSSL